MKRFLFLLLALIGFLKIMTQLQGCANPIAPSGGPRDSLPPMLVEVIPGDSTRSFNSNKITFTFNEFVDLDNVQQNLVVSPMPKLLPQVERKLRTVTVKIKDTLEENTTYTYDFGNAIKDINEGNVAKNFTYVFSTGKSIDSLELRGHIVVAETGKIDSTMVAMLHTSTDDSAVVKEKPRYIAKLDGSGNFIFHHLPPGTFTLYAMKDEGGQYRYLSTKQAFAFADKPVTIGSDNPPVILYAYVKKVVEDPKKTTSGTRIKPMSTDKTKAQDKRLSFRNSLEGGQQDLLSDLVFTFTEPLKVFDSSKIQFVDEQYRPITNYQLTKDTSNTKLSLSYKWKENTPYNLIVDKDFAEDSAGRKISRTDTLRFRTMKETDYGSIRIRINNFDASKKPVLQLLQGDDIKFAAKLTSKEFYVKLFKPGEYDIRILYDDNDNGVWDSGDFFDHHRQPEKAQTLNIKLTVKANWDKDINITL